ncbi:hypothetical protein NA57DRAFT_77963 [Rhizodiscina lignyota]|uniref:Uncharacterized protein n=1 Tax=Rhizodiscina lignyota TaxID=1504668 RepID=A0A9P4M419_9PEZI|nr:hypothetical protein NA57DRAFT_77963 [Rhizodiscina lignyota]
MRSVSPISEKPPKDSPSKRKRSISDPTVHQFAPHLREEIAGEGSYTDAQLAGARSPRSFVAEKLGDLKLTGTTLSVIRFCGGADGVNGDRAKRNKKVKFSGKKDNGVGEEQDGKAGESLKAQPKQRRLRSPPPPGDEEVRSEIEETPEPPRASSQSPSPSLQSTINVIPAELPTAAAPADSSAFHHSGSPSPMPAPQQYFDESEGREFADALDPDDDGTGINGVGYKPTPAMAWQRSQKRKQQIQEWRARETKEARQRRLERRHKTAIAAGGDGGARGGADDVRRTVRFAV